MERFNLGNDPWKRVLERMRDFGIAITAIAGGVAGVPLALPENLQRVVLYLMVIGTILSVGSQAVINDWEKGKDEV